MTSFNPDQTSLTAQTLISTNLRGSAISRMVSSVMSVSTPEDFFGHDTQTKPVGKVIPLEEAVRRLSGLPATNLELDRRGFLKEGMFADVVIFDPAAYAVRKVGTEICGVGAYK